MQSEPHSACQLTGQIKSVILQIQYSREEFQSGMVQIHFVIVQVQSVMVETHSDVLQTQSVVLQIQNCFNAVCFESLTAPM